MSCRICEIWSGLRRSFPNVCWSGLRLRVTPRPKDEDSLPPYAILDPILKAYVEEDRALDIVAMGFARETVVRVMAMVDRSEYKRQAGTPRHQDYASGIRKDRRMPITNGYR